MTVTDAPRWLCGVSTFVAVITTGSACLTSGDGGVASGLGSWVTCTFCASARRGTSRMRIRTTTLRFTGSSFSTKGVRSAAPDRSPDSWIVARVLPSHSSGTVAPLSDRTALPAHSGGTVPASASRPTGFPEPGRSGVLGAHHLLGPGDVNDGTTGRRVPLDGDGTAVDGREESLLQDVIRRAEAGDR